MPESPTSAAMSRMGPKPGLPPWRPHVRLHRVQTLVREGSPLVMLRNSVFSRSRNQRAILRETVLTEKKPRKAGHVLSLRLPALYLPLDVCRRVRGELLFQATLWRDIACYRASI